MLYGKAEKCYEDNTTEQYDERKMEGDSLAVMQDNFELRSEYRERGMSCWKQSIPVRENSKNKLGNVGMLGPTIEIQHEP